MARYRLIEPVQVDRKRHEPGEVLDLDDKVAGPLLAQQAIEPEGDLPFDDPPPAPAADGGGRRGKGRKG